MKKCPYCAEEIQDEAIKCKHCGSILNERPKTAWYFKTSTLVFAFLCVGPLALPLLWFNSRFSRNAKVIISIIIIAVSYALGVMLSASIKSMSNYYKFLLQG